MTIETETAKARRQAAFVVSAVRTRRSKASRGPRDWVGFTVVELMLAIAIIAVLAVIAVASYQSYYEKVRIKQAEADIVSIAAAIDLYRMDNKVLPDSLAEVGRAAMLDPWKHPYRYLNLTSSEPGVKGQARKDKNLVPINTDYDLYSMGKDGMSTPALTAKSSHDDIVRANDGRFVGLASDY